MKRAGNPRWKGGTYLDQDGYRHVLTDNGYRLEHRMVVEREIGRPLRPTEVVHHEDQSLAARADNRPSNLRLYQEAGSHIIENHSRRDPLTGRFLPK